ncbi:MAG: MlaD family protein [Candidatus Entotheonellia bacterium]
MGRRANPTLIGAFLVGALALIVIGILVFARGQFLTEKRTFVSYFDGSVKGLNIGAPVDFKGVRVGSVTDIRVDYMTNEGEFRLPVFIEIEPDRISQVGVRKTREERLNLYQGMIERGLRAQLGTVSLVTGQLYVQLDFFPGTPAKLVGRLAPLLDGLSDTSKVARATLVQTQQTVDKDVTVMLQEITSSARALRLLADYLERNPNALLYGKGSDRR